MRRSFLALFRDADGRSLARALACLLLVNAIVGGLAQGAMAAADPAVVLCTATGGVQPAADESGGRNDGGACCEMGCVPQLPAVASTPDPLPAPRIAHDLGSIAAPAATFVPLSLPAAHQPRGPPLLA